MHTYYTAYLNFITIMVIFMCTIQYTTSTISLLYFIMPTLSCTYVPSNVYVDTYMLECGGGGKLLELLKALKMYFVSDIISLPTFSYRRMLPREICPVPTKYKQTKYLAKVDVIL